MQNLREAITAALAKSWDNGRAGQLNPVDFWKDISKARLAIAQHMSKLEKSSRFEDNGYPLWHEVNVQAGPRANPAQAVSIPEALYRASDEQLHHEYNRRGLKPRPWDKVHTISNPTGPDAFRKLWELSNGDVRNLVGQKFVVEVKTDKPSVPVVPSSPGPQRIAIEKLTTDELLKELTKRLQNVFKVPEHVQCRCTVVPLIDFGLFKEYGKPAKKRKPKKRKAIKARKRK
jgi:hypothetical protein